MSLKNKLLKRFRIFLKLTIFTITQNCQINKEFGMKGNLSGAEIPGIMFDLSSYQQVMPRTQTIHITCIVTHDSCERGNLVMSMPLCHPSSSRQLIIHTHIRNPSYLNWTLMEFFLWFIINSLYEINTIYASRKDMCILFW